MEGGRTWPWESGKKRLRKRELERQTTHCLKLYLLLNMSEAVPTAQNVATCDYLLLLLSRFSRVQLCATP